MLIRRLSFEVLLNKFHKFWHEARFFHSSRISHRKKAPFSAKHDFSFKDFFAEEAKSSYVSDDLLKMSSENQRVSKKRPELAYRGEILYGIFPVYLALMQQKRHFYRLFVKGSFSEEDGIAKSNVKDEIKKLADILNIKITHLHSHEMRKLVAGHVHQGVCLDASPYPLLPHEEKHEELCPSDHVPLWIILNEIQDPMNVGAVLRSSYYFGADRILVTENSCRLSPTVSKASSGALEVLNIYELPDLLTFLKGKVQKGWNVVLSSPCDTNQCENTLSLSDFQLTKPTLLILGNEGRGVSPEVRQLCSHFVSIYPCNMLHSGMDSLNVSVAAGIFLYHLLGQRESAFHLDS